MTAKLLETWNKLPTAGKIAVGAGVVGVIVYVWKSGSGSTAPTLTPTMTSPTTYGDGGGTSGDSSGGTSWGGSTGGSDSGSSSGGSSGTGNDGSGNQGGSIGGTTPIHTPTPSTPVVVHPTQIDIGQAKTPTYHVLPTHQTTADVQAGKQWHSTVTDLTGNVNATDVSSISHAKDTSMVRKPTKAVDYVVAQGGAYYNAGVNGAHGQWINHQWDAGSYDSHGVFHADTQAGANLYNQAEQKLGRKNRAVVGK